MIETSPVDRLLGNIRQPSVIFGHLRKFLENDRKRSYELWAVFGEFSKIFVNLRKSSENLPKYLGNC